MFGDLKTPAGVKALDAFLADNSYIEGYVSSQADTAVFEALKGAPGSDTPHAQRWYNHIKSFAAGMKQFAKASKDAAAYVEGGAAPAAAEEEDDDDCDLFGSDEDEEDSEEKQKIVAERLKAYAERKAKKPGPIAKTNVLLDVKPWDDETDMDAMLKEIKTIAKDGFVWGANKLVPVGYGINKLQVMCVVEETMRTAGINEVLYFAYDFNRQCDMRNWENLDTLLDEQQLHQYQEQYGYHLQSREGEYLARQTGVFRTNCIDSLDRTNVAQSLIARRNFQAM